MTTSTAIAEAISTKNNYKRKRVEFFNAKAVN